MVFQISAAMLDACVLSVLSKQDVYGYLLTQNLKAVIEVSESALYPVLRRLQKDAFLDTYDQPYQGRNRRYYKITPNGRQKLEEYIGEWTVYKQRLDEIFGGDSNDKT